MMECYFEYGMECSMHISVNDVLEQFFINKYQLCIM